jgi:ATP-binding cassette, subfamily F, member 3
LVDMLVGLNCVSKSFGSNLLLKDVSFQLNFGEKVGLVGKNGSGKTTLLRLIDGELEADYGQVSKNPSVKIGFMRQIPPGNPNNTLLDEALSVFTAMAVLGEEIRSLEAEIESKAQESQLQSLLDRYGQLQTQWELQGGYSYRARTEAVLSGLGFDERKLGKSTAELSGGELNRLNLAKLLLSTPNLLLLDEPTNHLDVSAIKWLETYLKDFPHAFILISHDRCFLDATVTKILEINNGQVEEYSGNYSRYAQEREKRFQSRLKAYGVQREFIEKTEDFIRRNLAGQKTKQAQSRRRVLDKMERIELGRSNGPQAKFRFELDGQSGNIVFKLSNLEIGYGGKSIAKRINLTLLRGERIGIMGPNGSGKTTLLKTLVGLQVPLHGEVSTGPNVNIAFYDQQLSDLTPDLTVLEEMRSVSPLARDETLRGYLARFLFRGDEVFQSVSTLSGGEKSRLALAKLIFGKANTLILDEPTNHLDIPSREALEAALQTFSGTLIVVSHDRYLINKLVGRVIYLDGKGNFRELDASYEDFEVALTNDTNGETNQHSLRSEKTQMEEKSSASKKLSKNEFNKVKSRCFLLEQEIQKIEGQMKLTTVKLSEPSIARDFVRLSQLSDQHRDLMSRLTQLYLEWEESLALLDK